MAKGSIHNIQQQKGATIINKEGEIFKIVDIKVSALDKHSEKSIIMRNIMKLLSYKKITIVKEPIFLNIDMFKNILRNNPDNLPEEFLSQLQSQSNFKEIIKQLPFAKDVKDSFPIHSKK